MITLAVLLCLLLLPFGVSPVTSLLWARGSLVYVGLASDGGASAQSFSWVGTRAEVQSRTAKLALNRVRLRVLGE